MTTEEEYLAADAVRAECFAHIRAMLRDGTDEHGGASFRTWMLRHRVAAEAQIRALAELQRMEAECANLRR